MKDFHDRFVAKKLVKRIERQVLGQRIDQNGVFLRVTRYGESADEWCTVNLSEGGMYVEAVAPMVPGARAEVGVHIDDAAQELICQAEVRWRNDPDDPSFDPATGEFYWTPAEDQQGQYRVTFTATDDGTPTESDSETITITVNEVNVAPVLPPIADQTVNEQATLSFTVLAASDQRSEERRVGKERRSRWSPDH